MEGNITYQVRQLWNIVDGIGISKKESRANSNYFGQNGHLVSDKVHSYNSKDEFINRAIELATYAKKIFGIKDMQAITNKVIESYIQEKINDDLVYESISTYISQLEKIQIALAKMKINKPEHKYLFDREGLITVREMAKDQAVRSTHENRAFERPDYLRSEIKEDYKVSFDLQRNFGLRVNEATYIKTSQLQNNILTIQGKGGYLREIDLPKELLDRLSNQLLINDGKIEIPYSSYKDNMEVAAKKTKQNYEGTHGLRYNYVQERYQIKLREGKTHQNALKEISHEIGHNRPEITEHYLK